MNIETTATNFVARLAPWLSPIPTAYLVGRATLIHLLWPLPVAIIAAVIIEGLGLSAINTALELREYNANRRKSDPGAPFILALALACVYFATAITLTVALDTLPTLARYAPAIFPILSLCGVTVLALRSDHKRRLEAIEADKQARKAANAARRTTQGVRSASVGTAQATHFCEACERMFTSQQGLAAHIRHRHRNGHVVKVLE